MDSIAQSVWVVWIALPLLIFFARITDVTIGTMRILFVVRGATLIAALLGFVEVFVWIVVVRQILNQDSFIWPHYVAYAAGFAAGNVVGIALESRLAFGLQTVRVITGSPTVDLERDMARLGYGATRIAATGLRGGSMTILFSTLPRGRVKEAMQLIERHLPHSFISVEDVRAVNGRRLTTWPARSTRLRLPPFAHNRK